MNASVKGRMQEAYIYQKCGRLTPAQGLLALILRSGRLAEAEDFNRLLKDLHNTIYVPNKLPPATVNIIGYYVDEKSEDYLKDITRGLPGKFKLFRK